MNKHFDLLFNNENVTVITDEQDRPWFLAKQIAKLLRYDTTAHMLRICFPYEIMKINIKDISLFNKEYSNGTQIQVNKIGPLSGPILNPRNNGILGKRGPSTITLISEPGIYHILYATNHPLTKDFQDWTYSQVMPSIRATGSYIDNDIRELIRSRPDLIDEYLNEQKVIMDMWNNIEEDNENWVHESTKYEHLFDDPYDKLKYGIE